MASQSHSMAYNATESIAVPQRGFNFTPTDSTAIIDPNTSKAVLARAITTRDDGNLQVTYAVGTVAVIVPMFAGVRRSMCVTKIWATNTDADMITNGVIVEY